MQHSRLLCSDEFFTRQSRQCDCLHMRSGRPASLNRGDHFSASSSCAAGWGLRSSDGRSTASRYCRYVGPVKDHGRSNSRCRASGFDGLDSNQLHTALAKAVAAEKYEEAAEIKVQMQQRSGDVPEASWENLGLPQWLAERVVQLGYVLPTGHPSFKYWWLRQMRLELQSQALLISFPAAFILLWESYLLHSPAAANYVLISSPKRASLRNKHKHMLWDLNMDCRYPETQLFSTPDPSQLCYTSRDRLRKDSCLLTATIEPAELSPRDFPWRPPGKSFDQSLVKFPRLPALQTIFVKLYAWQSTLRQSCYLSTLANHWV